MKVYKDKAQGEKIVLKKTKVCELLVLVLIFRCVCCRMSGRLPRIRAPQPMMEKVVGI